MQASNSEHEVRELDHLSISLKSKDGCWFLTTKYATYNSSEYNNILPRLLFTLRESTGLTRAIFLLRISKTCLEFLNALLGKFVVDSLQDEIHQNIKSVENLWILSLESLWTTPKRPLKVYGVIHEYHKGIAINTQPYTNVKPYTNRKPYKHK